MSERMHVWITGAGSGLGAALARQLGSVAFVSLSGRRQEPLDELAKELGTGSACVAACDVAIDESAAEAHGRIVEKFGPVDVLINNAGIAMFSPAIQTSMQDFAAHLEVNLLGAVRCSQLVLPEMMRRRRGMILSMNSVASVTTFQNCTAYAASKAGLLAYTRGLRQEVRQHGVKVVDLLIGATATDIWSAEMLEEHRHRMISPSDVALAARDVILRYDHPAVMIEEMIIRPQLGDL
jgi:short-subunit dehydrogenase